MQSWLALFGKLGPLLLALWAALPQSALALTASQVYEQVKDSVVVVKAFDQTGKPVGLGSGVRLPSGDVITNYHVVKAGVRYTVGRGKQAAPATLKAGDPDKDLCLLTAPGLVAEPARLGKAARLKVGDPVYAVGAPQGLELSLSEGIVSQLRGGPPPLIQTTVAISKGSSGGGLFNSEGELVGITTFYLKDGQSLNFALPVERIAEVAGNKIRERPRGEAPGAPETGTRTKHYWLDQFNALFLAGDWQGMVALFRRWTKAEPGNFIAWHYLGIAYGQMGRHRDAVEAYQQALRLEPDSDWTWSNLGGAFIELGQYKDAVEAYREALRLKPDSSATWATLGNTYAKMGRNRDAVEALLEGLRLEPDDEFAWIILRLHYGLSDNRSTALEAVKQLRRYNPQRADKLFNLIMKP